MLLRYLADQVGESWDFFRPIVCEMVPEEYRTGLGPANILRAILLDEAILWGFKHEDNIDFFVLTSFMEDKVLNLKGLVIYGIYAVNPLPRKDWLEGLETLKKFAKHEGCGSILGYTSIPAVAKIARQLGAGVEFVRIDIEL